MLGCISDFTINHMLGIEVRIDMNRFCLKMDKYGQPLVIFEISTETAGTVFMTTRKFGEQDNNRAVVFVDANKLIELWKNDPYNSEPLLAYGNESIWRSDLKFSQAERGFSFGKCNPVPLASIECSTHVYKNPVWQRKFLLFKELVGVVQEEVSYIGFIDGITRAIWLLANNAKNFPVECSLGDAKLLQKEAGVIGSTYITVADLYSGI
ncbi:hypothetical protein [Shewanella sp. Isolate8]|uniref:plasmid fertility inhibition factor family protein n=1 Tax=Shewanella sp. Isolate8 TaxID=2908529 RepID=UPI001EFE8BA3|nr:hypothetical protein [Shewanella sp. Isolate8]MCG9745983.1 hypothetical protein [Shewanella sp. Isolate8]